MPTINLLLQIKARQNKPRFFFYLYGEAKHIYDKMGHQKYTEKKSFYLSQFFFSKLNCLSAILFFFLFEFSLASKTRQHYDNQYFYNRSLFFKNTDVGRNRTRGLWVKKLVRYPLG